MLPNFSRRRYWRGPPLQLTERDHSRDDVQAPLVALAHPRRMLRAAGGARIDSSVEVDGLQSVAFRHDDDGSTVLSVCNPGAAAPTFPVR